MALMNLFSGQQGRNRHREQTMDTTGGEEGEGRCKETETWELPPPCVKQPASGMCRVTQGTQQRLCDRLRGGVGRQLGGGSRREGTLMYLLLILVDV